MTSSREKVLNAVRRSLRPGGMAESGRQAADDRLAEPPRGVIPERGRRPHEAQVTLFMEMAAAVDATVERVADASEVPGRIAAYLRGRNLPHSLVHGADRWIAELPWDDEPALERQQGRAGGD